MKYISINKFNFSDETGKTNEEIYREFREEKFVILM